MLGLLGSVGTVMGYLADAVKYGPFLFSFIHSVVSDMEATDKSGPDKLTAVLNAVETFAEELLPDEAKEIEAFMTSVEALVNDIVALKNEVGAFVHKAA